MTAARRTPRVDGDLTRSKILEAAGLLFAQGGYAETSSKAVAMMAEVDLAAINYHFGGRSGLYQAVLLEGHRRLISLDTLMALEAGSGSAKQKLGHFIDSLVERIYSEHGWPVRVCARELLSPSVHFEALMNDGILPKSEIIRGFVAAIVGLPKDDPVLSRCMVCVMAPCLMLLVGSRAAPAPVQDMLTLPAQSLAEHLKCFTLAGLEGVRQSLSPAMNV
ncbi:MULTISPECIES: TetR/AcrR family transcriptional regulator [unclassified Pseudomonas]|uniref:TetR/AcrR family transcriptional regulator n=1 Tax=unclassified Pseudomonas TaxID=196821 RepID=UPI0025E0B325|nr:MULTISPECIES: CerR family C-terminal domain-containing protein [unclassified Pseudomonas]